MSGWVFRIILILQERRFYCLLDHVTPMRMHLTDLQSGAQLAMSSSCCAVKSITTSASKPWFLLPLPANAGLQHRYEGRPISGTHRTLIVANFDLTPWWSCLESSVNYIAAYNASTFLFLSISFWVKLTLCSDSLPSLSQCLSHFLPQAFSLIKSLHV